MNVALYRRKKKSKSATRSQTKCKCCSWGGRKGSGDISSVVSQCYSSCWGHENPYRLYYSQLMAIRLSSGQRSPRSAEKRTRCRSVLCFLINFSLAPIAPTTFSVHPAALFCSVSPRTGPYIEMSNVALT